MICARCRRRAGHGERQLCSKCQGHIVGRTALRELYRSRGRIILDDSSPGSSMLKHLVSLHPDLQKKFRFARVPTARAILPWCLEDCAAAYLKALFIGKKFRNCPMPLAKITRRECGDYCRHSGLKFKRLRDSSQDILRFISDVEARRAGSKFALAKIIVKANV